MKKTTITGLNSRDEKISIEAVEFKGHFYKVIDSIEIVRIFKNGYSGHLTFGEAYNGGLPLSTVKRITKFYFS